MSWYPAEQGRRRLARGPTAALSLAVGVAVAAVVVAAVWLPATSVEQERASPPTAAASPGAAPASSAGTERSTGLLDPGEEIARIAGQVADVRGLTLREPVAASLLDQQALQTVLARLTSDDDGVGGAGATGDAAARARLLTTLRLLPRNRDLASAVRRLQADEAVGLYSPDERRLYVRDEGRTTPQLRWASAHELVHALQHQHVDITALLEHPVGALDAELAALALLEGDAVVTQEAWSQRFQTAEERQQLGAGAAVPLLGLAGQQPVYLTERFSFPYVAGARFVVWLLESGGFPAVDAALSNPPQTTAEILEPDRYLAGLEVVEVDLGEGLAAEWTSVRDDELGAFDLLELLRPLGATRASELTMGWSGGRVRSWERGGEVSVAGAVAFASTDGAKSLCEALPGWWRVAARAEDAGARLLSSEDGWMSYRCAGAQVRFAVAPDAQTARALAG